MATVAEEIMRQQENFNLTRIVCDAGALGKGYVEEFRRRYNLPVQMARKQDKAGYRRLLNGDLERAVIKVVIPENIGLIEELQGLCWDAKGRDAAPGQPDHLSDAFLYTWREAKHYLAREPDRAPVEQGELAKLEADRMMKDAMRKAKLLKKRKRGSYYG